jgi:hypothetical protein
VVEVKVELSPCLTKYHAVKTYPVLNQALRHDDGCMDVSILLRGTKNFSKLYSGLHRGGHKRVMNFYLTKYQISMFSHWTPITNFVMFKSSENKLWL